MTIFAKNYQLKIPAGVHFSASPKKRRHQSGWRTIGGKRIYFRSKWEANIARQYQWLKEKGQIAQWEFETHTFWFLEIKRGVRSYLPDFRITENDGRTHWVEVKGHMDNKSATKLKRMAKYYPNESVQVIGESAYLAIARSMKGLVPDWE